MSGQRKQLKTIAPGQGETLFRVHWFCWKILGLIPPAKHKWLYILYSVLFNTIITVAYPLHLTIGLFNSNSQYEIFKNLAINLTCTVCALKMLIIWWKLAKVRAVVEIVKKLDKRITHPAEMEYYRRVVVPASKKVLQAFYFLCLGCALLSEGACCLSGILNEWRLLYPAYFPFDPYATKFNYIVAHIYQIFGVSVAILQNLANDTIGAMALALLAGHVRILGMRVARIGHDKSKSVAQNNAELLECIQDHRNLLVFHHLIEDVISWSMLFQIILTGVNMCIVIIFMIFYVNDALYFIYYVVYLLAMPMEIFPCCYYGTYLEMEFEQLTYTILSCNWMEQDRNFKKNLRIFAEQSLKAQETMAGGMLRINLNSFFMACKLAYSLFAVVGRMK